MALFEGHDRIFHITLASLTAAKAFDFPLPVQGVNGLDLNVEELLNRPLDFGLSGGFFLLETKPDYVQTPWSPFR